MRSGDVSGPGTDQLVELQTDAFWRRHVDTGMGSFVFGAVALLVYFWLTPDGAHRALLEVLTGASIGCWVFVFAPIGKRLVTTRWRRAFFMTWSLSTLAVVAIAAGLDGGSRSPLGVLMVLPVLYAALVYPPADVAVMAVLAELAYVILVIVEPAPGASRSLVTGVMLALAGGISSLAAVNRFVQERARARLASRLHEMATHDGLTGCLSYRAFREALEAEAARACRYLRPFSLILADLDSFKAINDTYGHDVGDKIVRGVARASLPHRRTSPRRGRAHRR